MSYPQTAQHHFASLFSHNTHPKKKTVFVYEQKKSRSRFHTYPVSAHLSILPSSNESRSSAHIIRDGIIFGAWVIVLRWAIHNEGNLQFFCSN